MTSNGLKKTYSKQKQLGCLVDTLQS